MTPLWQPCPDGRRYVRQDGAEAYRCTVGRPRWHVFVAGQMPLFMEGGERRAFASAEDAMQAADELFPAEGWLALGRAA